MIENTELFICPVCLNQTEGSHKSFCSTCGYLLPQNEQRQVIVNEFHIASRENIRSPEDPQLDQQSGGYVQKSKAKWKFWPGLVVPIGAILIMGIIGFVVFLFQLSNSNFEYLLLSIPSLLFFIIPILWIPMYYKTKLPWKSRLKELKLPLDKYKDLSLVREILLGICIGMGSLFLSFLLQLIGAWFIRILYNIDIYLILDDSTGGQFALTTPVSLLELLLIIGIMLILVGIPEEVMFRGFVQRSFETKLNKSSALVLTAFFFALFHIITYIVVPPVFLFLLFPYFGVSIIFGIVRNWRDDIIACSSAHIVYNIMQTIIIYIIFT